MIHTDKLFRNFTERFAKEGSVHKYYGMYWIMQELLAQNKNKILLSELQQKIDEYNGGFNAEDMIDFFRVQDGYLFSPFQDEVYKTIEKNKRKRRKNSELQQELEQAQALIRRLEAKIEFLKNPKPKLKRKF